MRNPNWAHRQRARAHTALPNTRRFNYGRGGDANLAEAKFKEIQRAYQTLSDGGLPLRGEAGGGPRRTAAGRARTSAGASYSRDDEWWGKEGQYGAAHRPGYETHGAGYMGFGGKNGNQHFYEDAASAAVQQDAKRAWVSYAGVALFAAGLGAVVLSSGRERQARQDEDMVEAWMNPATRRWERVPPHLRKSPMLSSLIELKPKAVVNASTPSGKSMRRRPSARTLDGARAADAYRAREQGHRN